ncbi:MAG: glycosyl transferase group 1 [Bacteroidetes bacterium HGW-Bacteroidetes-21]|jgi:glycosyltransferase involved in cell wall biosynthesis|nr:MAG: glycosyl transferase group 1 [Bacteroidetes bacterium HGW-Bacteroidetes-21]
MKITYIVPGFGGTFYCGNCLRDSAFTKALRVQGHDSITLPLYLPHSIEEFAHQTDVPVFYGAVNIYLKQNFRLFRKMPGWMYRFFNSPAILKFAAKKSSSTRAVGLEKMTISMLQGADGYQKEELDQLIYFLKHHEKPDVVHLSNALLMGLAAKIREEVNVPVFCTLQDEDVWIDAMNESYIPELWNLMSEKAKDVDAFIAVSSYFKDVMQRNMHIADKKIHVVPLGVNPEDYIVQSPATNPPALGYLSRMNEGNGMGIIVDAFILLKKQPAFSSLRLILTGGKTTDDNKYINKQIHKLQENGMMDDVEFIDDFRPNVLDQFFSKISVLSVPVLKGEAFGLYQLEALASGIPIVQPAIGAFPEIAEISSAGEVYSPNNPSALAAKLSEVLSNKEKLMAMGKNGRKSVEETFNLSKTTKKLVDIYEHEIELRRESL